MRFIRPQRSCTRTASQVPVTITSLGHSTALKIRAWRNTGWEPRSAGGISRGYGRSQGMACISETLKINLRYLGLEPMRLFNSKNYWLCVNLLARRATPSPRRCAPSTEQPEMNSESPSNKRKKITLNSMRRCKYSWRTKWGRRSQ